jgi:hypothetical protein
MGLAGHWKRLHNFRKVSKPPQEQDAKMSQRLIEVAQPSRNCGDDLDEYRKQLSFAAIAWNLTIIPPDLREGYIINSSNLRELKKEDQQLISQRIAELARRKEQLFPQNRRMIANVDVLDEGDEIRVLVTTLV